MPFHRFLFPFFVQKMDNGLSEIIALQLQVKGLGIRQPIPSEPRVLFIGHQIVCQNLGKVVSAVSLISSVFTELALLTEHIGFV